ncbi:RNA polymerase sigma-70 region 4 domain-containing protein [Cupriavidus sp. H18C1]
MIGEKGARKEPPSWVVERLYSWGAWAARGGQRNGYGPSCLTLEEIRTLPVRAYIPVSDPECEQTHEALRKLPLDWFRLAGLIYIKQMPVYLAAEDVGMSRAQGYRVQGLIFKGVEFLIRNPRLKDPPLHLLLKS